MFPMELMIERGQARCPHCAAVAVYSFVELGPNLLRYEVNCRGCGEIYRERVGPVPPELGVVAATEPWWPAEQVPRVPLRERVHAGAGMVRDHTAALTAAAAAAFNRRDVPRWLAGVLARAQRP
jgi:rubredoxin